MQASAHELQVFVHSLVVLFHSQMQWPRHGAAVVVVVITSGSPQTNSGETVKNAGAEPHAE